MAVIHSRVRLWAMSGNLLGEDITLAASLFHHSVLALLALVLGAILIYEGQLHALHSLNFHIL